MKPTVVSLFTPKAKGRHHISRNIATPTDIMLPNKSFYNFTNWKKKKDYRILACAVVLYLNCKSDTRYKIFNDLLR